jgi:hypothetical protein
MSFLLLVPVDARARRMHSCRVSKPKKPAVNTPDKKTPGTVAVEKYRPAMNKLTDAEREKLMARAMVTIYGQPENAGRR